MHYQQPKTTGKTVAIVILAFLLLLAVGIAVFFALGGPQRFFLPATPPAPYFADGDVKALRLAPPKDAASEEGLRQTFREALDWAEEQGYNTLLFEAKTDGTVWWRDDIFPPNPAFSAGDSFFKKLDPMQLLFEEAEGRPVQIWLEIDPYAAGGAAAESKAKAVRLAAGQGNAAAFSAGDAAYRALLEESIAALPRKYPIAGIVFAGFGGESQAADAVAFQDGLSAFLSGVNSAFGAKNLAARPMLHVAQGDSLLTGPFVQGLVATGQVRTLLAEVPGGRDLTNRIAAYGSGENTVVFVVRPGGEEDATVKETPATPLAGGVSEAGASGPAPATPIAPGSGLADGGDQVAAPATDASGATFEGDQVLFTASRLPVYGGVQLGSYPAVLGQETALCFYESALVALPGTTLPEGFVLPTDLRVNYPAEGATFGAAQEAVYVMGNASPDEPLLLDGAEVPTGQRGTFGALVHLQPGENVFTFSQGGSALAFTLHRAEPSESGGGGGTATVPNDNTKEAQPGQAVQIAGVFTGGLSDPSNDGAINETYYGGAVGVVRESVQLQRWFEGRNVMTWAYKLTNGDYVMAWNCIWIDGDGASAFTGLSAAADDRGRGEWITFEGKGTPAAWLACEDGTLRVTMHDTSFALPEGFSSNLVQGASVEEIDGGVVLRLQVPEIWGYQIEYKDGQTRLFLKSAPTLSADPAEPLAGVRILLDPGHGGEDIGAPGIMDSHGPNEKDINLAQAQAIAYRLRQLGADVTMIREDDTYSTTHERLAVVIEEKPDLFISVHHNSAEMNADRSGASGAQVYYHLPSGYSAPRAAALAQNLMDGVVAATGRPASNAASGYYNVIRTPVCPAVLFEYAFMISPVDFEDASSADGLYAAACGTAQGVLETLGYEM